MFTKIYLADHWTILWVSDMNHLKQTSFSNDLTYIA